jgi:hypothetical protein
MEDDRVAVKARQQMSQVVAIAASKVEKKTKEETNTEKFKRITAENNEKNIRSVKRAAKGLIKKKKIKKLTAYFYKK